MHVHLERVGEVGLKLFIANGVTGIREMGGGDFAQIKLWRQKIYEGSLLGPQIKASGPILESPRFIQTLERITGKSLTGKRIGVGTGADARVAVDLIEIFS